MKRTSLPLLRRREFITLLGGAVVTWPHTAHTQQRGQVVGSLCGVSASEWADRFAGFRRGLSETGFVEGRNVAIEYRWADGDFDRLPAMASDLVARKVTVMFVSGSTVATQAAMAATRSIPIVFTSGIDPVAAGLVASLNRPGGNATGVTSFSQEIGLKNVELLHELLPAATKFALLVNRSNPQLSQGNIQDAQVAGRRLGLEIIVLDASTENGIGDAFAAAIQQRAGALQIGADSFFNSQRQQIAALALRHSLPTINWDRISVAAGMLMSYGADVVEEYRQAGAYVGRILKGEKPADLPVIQPAKFELVINLKTAKAIGLTIPESFLLRANAVIE
jgi:putative tryptophan/tyrosine transport system substrate-binding protein